MADVPVGTIVAFAGGKNKIPKNWMECNGKSLDWDDYKDLAKAIGTTWGGRANIEIKLPDLRGYFLRGVGSNRTHDPDIDERTAVGSGDKKDVGSIQTDSVGKHIHEVNDPKHNHGITDPGHNHGITDPGHRHSFTFFNNDGGRGNPGGTFPRDAGSSGTDSSVTNITVNGNTTRITVNSSETNISIKENAGKESRPKNAYVYYIIKVKD